MLQEKIEKYFEKYRELKVLFFFDPGKQHEQEFNELELPDIKKVRFENNYFELKIKLNKDWIQEKVFLYLDVPAPKEQEDFKRFPLLDLLVANKELRTDDEAGFMEQYGLQRHQKDLVKKYIYELQYVEVIRVLKPILSPARFKEPELVQGLFSSFLGFSKIEDWELIIGKLLTYTLPDKEIDFNRVRNKVLSLNLVSFLNKRLSHYFKAEIKNFTVEEFATYIQSLKYNAITHNLDLDSKDPYKDLKITDTALLSSQNILVGTNLKHRYISDPLKKAMELHGAGIKETTIFNIYGADVEYNYMPDALKWELIKHHVVYIDTNPEATIRGIEYISLVNNATDIIKSTTNFVLYAAYMIKAINTSGSFIYDTPEEYLEKYATEHHRIDFTYRKAIVSFTGIEISSLPKGVDVDQLKELLEKRYDQFLQKLNREWLKCLNEIGFDYSKVKVQKQFDFFEKEIKPYDQKIAVIISDALRYEVANELLTELHRDERNQARLKYQLASIPSETSLGMANLLPVNKMEYDSGNILVNSTNTKTTAERTNILNSINSSYIAESFDTIYKNNQEENRDLFKNKLVYIYHDVIDKEGHKGNERNTFDAAKRAIQELTKLVKMVHSSYAVSRVIITADHGFLYNDKKIEEADKDLFPDVTVIESGARHVVTKKDCKFSSGYVVSLSKTTKIKDDYYVIIPASVNRMKKPGAKYQFTHGGGSLQELVVPIIESSRKRQDIENKVNPILVKHQALSVVSNTLRILILQERKISQLEKERTIVIGIYADSELVSNQPEIILNSASEIASERSYLADLALTSKATGKSILKLKIFDIDDKLNAIIEETVMNNTLIERDF